PAIVPLGQGAMFTAIIWGAIAVFLLERDFVKAAIFSVVGAVLTFVGIMHAPKLALNANPEFMLGYIIMGAMFIVFNLTADVKKGSSAAQDISMHVD
ncbi:MAG: NCS2 family permease, partial [Bacillota bacterium]|nr:NCS2 family permease [Bacillota bacterium]